jgi:hypothetical protein
VMLSLSFLVCGLKMLLSLSAKLIGSI